MVTKKTTRSRKCPPSRRPATDDAPDHGGLTLAEFLAGTRLPVWGWWLVGLFVLAALHN